METGLRSGRYGAAQGLDPTHIPAEASIEAVSALGAGHSIVAASVGAAALVDGALAAAAAVDASSHELSRMRHSEFLRPSGFYAAPTLLSARSASKSRTQRVRYPASRRAH